MKQWARQIWPSWYEAYLSHKVIEVLRDIPHRVEQRFPKDGPDKNIALAWTFIAGEDDYLAEFRWHRGTGEVVTVNMFVAERLRAKHAVS